MDATQIKAHIQNKSFDKFYIFSGPEWKVQRLYIDQIARVSGKELRYIDSITDIYGKKGSKMFIPKSYVYVVRDDKEITQNEKIQEQLNSIIGSNILILLLTAPDKRTKFFKLYKDTIVEFEALKPAVLKKYIQKEIPLTDDNCNKLMEVCEYDYGRCLLEIDKIRNYGKARMQYDPNTLLHRLLQDGLIYQPPKDAIFDFVDAILDCDVNLSFNLYHQCLAVGEATMVMITVLYNNAKAVLQVQSCKNSDVSKATGLTGWQIMNAKKHLNKRRIGELLDIIDLCQQSQQAIVTGTMEEEFVMENLLVRIL